MSITDEVRGKTGRKSMLDWWRREGESEELTDSAGGGCMDGCLEAVSSDDIPEDEKNCGEADGDGGVVDIASYYPKFKTSMCFFYKKGRCQNGTDCRFAHGLSELKKHQADFVHTTVASQRNRPPTPPPPPSALFPPMISHSSSAVSSAHSPPPPPPPPPPPLCPPPPPRRSSTQPPSVFDPKPISGILPNPAGKAISTPTHCTSLPPLPLLPRSTTLPVISSPPPPSAPAAMGAPPPPSCPDNFDALANLRTQHLRSRGSDYHHLLLPQIPSSVPPRTHLSSASPPSSSRPPPPPPLEPVDSSVMLRYGPDGPPPPPPAPSDSPLRWTRPVESLPSAVVRSSPSSLISPPTAPRQGRIRHVCGKKTGVVDVCDDGNWRAAAVSVYQTYDKSSDNNTQEEEHNSSTAPSLLLPQQSLRPTVYNPFFYIQNACGIAPTLASSIPFLLNPSLLSPPVSTSSASSSPNQSEVSAILGSDKDGSSRPQQSTDLRCPPRLPALTSTTESAFYSGSPPSGSPSFSSFSVGSSITSTPTANIQSSSSSTSVINLSSQYNHIYSTQFSSTAVTPSTIYGSCSSYCCSRQPLLSSYCSTDEVSTRCCASGYASGTPTPSVFSAAVTPASPLLTHEEGGEEEEEEEGGGGAGGDQEPQLLQQLCKNGHQQKGEAWQAYLAPAKYRIAGEVEAIEEANLTDGIWGGNTVEPWATPDRPGKWLWAAEEVGEDAEEDFLPFASSTQSQQSTETTKEIEGGGGEEMVLDSESNGSTASSVSPTGTYNTVLPTSSRYLIPPPPSPSLICSRSSMPPPTFSAPDETAAAAVVVQTQERENVTNDGWTDNLDRDLSTIRAKILELISGRVETTAIYRSGYYPGRERGEAATKVAEQFNYQAALRCLNQTTTAEQLQAIIRPSIVCPWSDNFD